MFNPTLLQTFLVVVQTRSFTQAATRLGLRQPTVSQHIRKLEEEAGRRLLVRDTHSVATTPDGEAMIELARGILSANDRAQHYFAGSQLRGRLRFGTSEDFVTSRLPDLLRDFVRTHPLVEFELTVGRSAQLNERLERGELDLVCGKRLPGDERGRVVSRDRLTWVSTNGYSITPAAPVPLILFSPPSVMREIALTALERSGRSWRTVCTSDSLSGLRAASLAGLGITVASEGLIPGGLTVIPGSHGLPDLGLVEFVVTGRHKAMHGPAAELADVILASGIRV
ncbi:MAG: LysR family transcriptional regulator [Xanthobacteraceae bacterium]